jgi:hypothetical protein
MVQFARLARLGFLMACVAASGARAQTINVPLTTSDTGKLSVGFFAGGTLLQLTTTGQGDLVDSRFEVLPDGSLATPASGDYTFANAGQPYPAVGGFPSGDGINHFTGGGANYDHSGSGWMFAGTQTTDTTDSTTIRGGTLVGTFSLTPSRADWFQVRLSRSFVVPGGGATLYLAVNDTFHADNHGTYVVNYAAVPEPGMIGLLAGAIAAGIVAWRRCRASA